ncbi:uncharacterized protein CCOS01_13881 [Colletotrichum costaricense]|uniref:tyrosinase n=1 Tax=Colletotrichum costaricense TaxID=1209916 RepID=A0AAI9YKZ4_9PEZI|nr:uncharacterized protein CCOS01_13881 [Colletotrichum costaricense]KAK1514600.1 hypothetical protein CCOS01_13881 [Colletotrichum costaricense]
MAPGTYPITGLPVPSGQEPPQRQEITAWSNKLENAIQVSLFIQALNIFQSMDPSDKLSYYQVAGIHGLPAQSWDTDPAPNKKQKLPITGTPQFYCPHGSLIFPTWHRAYLALYEQLLSGIMTDKILPNIADKTVQDIWALEITRWRLPYWDWAMPQTYLGTCGVPEIVSLQEIEIVSPNGIAKQKVQNPLYMFTTGVISALKGIPTAMDDETAFGIWRIRGKQSKPFDACSGTSRYGITNKHTPTTQEALGIENNASVAEALQTPDWNSMEEHKLDPNMTGSLQDQVHRLLTAGYFPDYATFATTEYGSPKLSPPPATGWLSLEFLHNCIHVWTGGDDAKTGMGHMAYLTVAAFDPIFWLHHSNVDRQLAIFQALNPTHWFDGGSPTKDETSTGPLHPFHSDTNGTLITSENVKATTTYGYTYDDLSAPPATLQKTINEKYGVLRKHLHANRNLAGKTNDYVINVQYDRFALNGRSYAVHFFVKGDVPSSPSEYRAALNHVGSIHTFSTDYWTAGNTNGVDCQNCQGQQAEGVVAKAQVPITLELLFRAVSDGNAWADLTSLEPDHIEKYLEQHLKWVVVAVPGEVIQTENLPGLKVVVHAGQSEHPEDTTQPSKFHSYRPMWSVTHGKTGGARREDNVVHADEARN